MGELHVEGAEAQNAQDKKAEVDPSLKARTRLQELLTPPEATADRIRGIVLKSAGELYGEKPHPEMKRIVEHAAGVFLWEQNVNDTENTLPPGLALSLGKSHDMDRGFNAPIYFDSNLLSREEYDYVIKHFAQTDVIAQVTQLQHEQLAEKKEDMAVTIDSLLRHSLLEPYFEGYGIGLAPETAPRPLQMHDREYWERHGSLEGAYRKRHGTLPGEETVTGDGPLPFFSGKADTEVPTELQLEPHPLEAFDDADAGAAHQYRAEVLGPLLTAEIDAVTDTRTNPTGTDKKRARYRNDVTNWYVVDDLYNRDSRLFAEDKVQIHDGKVFYQVGDKFIEDTYHLPGFAWRQLMGLNESTYVADVDFAASALAIMAPRLYNKDDPRTFDALVDASITAAASVMAEQWATDDYRPLTQRRRYPAPYSAQYRHLWLTDTIGPLVTEDPRHSLRFETTQAEDRTNSLVSNTIQETPVETLIRQDSVLAASRHYNNPAIFDRGPHIISAGGRRNPDLPTIPDGQTDLVIDCRANSLTHDMWSDKHEEYDPKVSDMTLVARDRNRAYFVRDKENERFDPSTQEISYIKKLLVTEFFQTAGMSALADQVEAADRLTIGELVSFMKQHTRYDVRAQPRSIEVTPPQSWQAFVDSGVLTGESEVFARFTKEVMSIAYVQEPLGPGKHAYRHKWPISIERGFLVEPSSQDVTGRDHSQVVLNSADGKYGYTIDISPDPRQMHVLLTELRAGAPSTAERADRDGLESDGMNIHELLSAKEYNELYNTAIGRVEHVTERVFDGVRQRLFSKVPRDENLPPLTDESYAQSDLRITVTTTDLADRSNDPALAGLRTIARSGSTYDFVYDPDNDPYKPVMEPIPEDKRRMLVDKCYEIGMRKLALILDQQETVTLEGLRQAVGQHMKYFIPEERIQPYILDSIDDFVRLSRINGGMLSGQCEDFRVAMDDLAGRVYGKDEIVAVGGHTLTDSAKISKMTHAQTYVKQFNALLDVEPAARDYHDTVKLDNEQAPKLSSKRSGYIEITIPESSGLALDTEAKVQEIELSNRMEGSCTRFLKSLDHYLDIAQSVDESYTEYAAKREARLGVILTGEDAKNNPPHVQLYTLIQDYRQTKNYSYEGPEYQFPAADVARLQQLLEQGNFPQYDEIFKKTMKKAVSAFSAWGRTQEQADSPEEETGEQLAAVRMSLREKYKEAEEERFMQRYLSEDTSHAASLHAAIDLINQRLYDSASGTFDRVNPLAAELGGPRPLNQRLASLPVELGEADIREILDSAGQLTLRERFWLKKLIKNYPRIHQLATETRNKDWEQLDAA